MGKEIDFKTALEPRLPFASPHIGKVGRPFLIRACRFKLPVQQIRRDRVDWRIKLSWRATSLVASLDAGRFHQSCHAVLAAGKTSVDQVSDYARRTICAIAGFIAVLDCLEELGILALMRTCGPAEPIVKTTA